MKKTEHTKNAIIDSTIKILRAQGNVTVKEIASDAHVNIAAINYHFNDKHNLITIVVRRLMAEFLSRLDMLMAATTSDREEIHSILRKFLDSFYDFVFENLGIIKYILIPNNREILEACSKYFMEQFSLDSAFTNKILTKIGEISTESHSLNELKVKYVFLFSAFAFPLIFQLDIQNFESPSLFQLNNEEIKNIYIEQLIKVILA